MKPTCDALRNDVLSDYVDGLLAAEEAAKVEDHLKGCRRCAEEHTRLKAMIDGLKALPEEKVPQDLWRRIEGSIRQEVATVGKPGLRATLHEGLRSMASVLFGPLRRPALAGAAAALALALAVTIDMPDREPREIMPTEMIVAGVIEELQAAELHYRKAIEALELVTTDKMATLPEGMAVELAANLEIIDGAIFNCRKALATDPMNRELRAHVFESYSHKITMLTEIARIEI